jgi:hypothetical protein
LNLVKLVKQHNASLRGVEAAEVNLDLLVVLLLDNDGGPSHCCRCCDGYNTSDSLQVGQHSEKILCGLETVLHASLQVVIAIAVIEHELALVVGLRVLQLEIFLHYQDEIVVPREGVVVLLTAQLKGLQNDIHGLHSLDWYVLVVHYVAYGQVGDHIGIALDNCEVVLLVESYLLHLNSRLYY